MTLLDVAIEYGVDRSTVSKRCAGIPRPADVRSGRARSVDYGRVAELRAKGMRPEVIAERFGITRRQVFRALKAHQMEAAQ